MFDWCLSENLYIPDESRFVLGLQCTEEAHRPVDCSTVSKWIMKNSAESENMNWFVFSFGIWNFILWVHIVDFCFDICIGFLIVCMVCFILHSFKQFIVGNWLAYCFIVCLSIRVYCYFSPWSLSNLCLHQLHPYIFIYFGVLCWSLQLLLTAMRFDVIIFYISFSSELFHYSWGKVKEVRHVRPEIFGNAVWWKTLPFVAFGKVSVSWGKGCLHEPY